jgi:hypothetical protein
MQNAGLARASGYGFSGADLCGHVVAGKIGSERGLCEAGDAIGANFSAAHRVEGTAFWQRESVMKLFLWLFGPTSGPDNYRRAISLADEVIQTMRHRANQRDPLKAVLADLLFQQHDPALVADAYEMSQEARIYKGPGGNFNGSGRHPVPRT